MLSFSFSYFEFEFELERKLESGTGREREERISRVAIDLGRGPLALVEFGVSFIAMRTPHGKST